MTLRRIGAWALLAVCVLPLSSEAQEEKRRAVERLLVHSEVESILSAVHDRFSDALSSFGAEIVTPEAYNSLYERLSLVSLRDDMVEEFGLRGDIAQFEAALSLMESGPIARLDSLVSAGQPHESLEEFAESLRVTPPPESRVEVIARLTMAQNAGDFFVLIDERTREGAHRVAEVAGVAPAPFEPISVEAWEEAARQNFFGALVSFLHRYQAADESLLEEVALAWESEAGQWYVEAYSLALGDAILRAADKIVADVSGG